MNIIAKNRLYKYNQLLGITTVIWIGLWVYRYLTGGLLHSISDAKIFDLWLDRSFWLLFLSNIPQTIIKNEVLCFLLDFTILLLPLVFWISKKRIFLVAFLVSYIVFSFTYEAYGFFHSKTSLLPLLGFLPYLSKKATFDLLFKGIRYYLIFVMVSAGLYKIFNGGVFDFYYFNSILINQHFLAIAENKHLPLISFLMKQPLICYGIYLGGTLIELFYVMGCFTYKYDKFLLVFLGLFIASTFVFFRIENLMLLPMGVSFWYSHLSEN